MAFSNRGSGVPDVLSAPAAARHLIEEGTCQAITFPAYGSDGEIQRRCPHYVPTLREVKAS